MRILLDSNAYSHVAAGRAEVAEIVWRAEEVLVSAIVLGELLYGFRAGSQFDQNIAKLRSFLNRSYVSLVDVGAATAEHYGIIAAAQRAKGRPIPTNDIWIAAHAMETGADLVSADGHFAHVDGIAWLPVAAG